MKRRDYIYMRWVAKAWRRRRWRCWWRCWWRWFVIATVDNATRLVFGNGNWHHLTTEPAARSSISNFGRTFARPYSSAQLEPLRLIHDPLNALQMILSTCLQRSISLLSFGRRSAAAQLILRLEERLLIGSIEDKGRLLVSFQKTQSKSHKGVAIERGRQGQRELFTAAIFAGFHSAQRRRAGTGWFWINLIAIRCNLFTRSQRYIPNNVFVLYWGV